VRLLWRMYISFFTCTLLALLATAWYGNHALRRFYQEQVAADLLVKANILANEIRSQFLKADGEKVDRYCKEFGRLTQTRVTVILPDGKVVGDSDRNPALMENHISRSEIQEALRGRTGKSVRFSDTIRRTLMYVAIPLERDGEVVGVVRTSVPLAVINWTLRSVYRHVGLGVLALAFFFAMLAFLLTRQMTQPLEAMRRTAERLALGDLQVRAPVPREEETATLARAMNQTAAQLAEKMASLTRQRDLQNAVFSSMMEGVLAVDSEGRILDLNPAAAQLLALDLEQARGRSIQEIVRNRELQTFIASALAAEKPVQTEIVLYGDTERCLQVHGTALTGSAGDKFGAVIVLTDITRIKRLEMMRRDFVANVSHELKTPITALRGAVETLSDAAPTTSEDKERFMSMMRRQVERLNAIVDDLLTLSRIEHDAEHKRIPRETGEVSEVLWRAVQACAGQAEAKKITISVECPNEAKALINAPLLEQAVGNLIDNAIKYSAEQSRIVAGARIHDDKVEIYVRDEGPGIEAKHLPRIFERFYRVDQARSRSLGGTGLGLAIVKHIALAHGGSVSVESTPGHGSTFIIRIPRA